MTPGTLPYRFLRRPGRVLVTSVAGEHTWLTEADFMRFAQGALVQTDAAWADLAAIQVVGDTSMELAKHQLALKVRTRLSWLADFTRLHIFVVTLRCNQSCRYCQVSRAAETAGSSYDMSDSVAVRAVDLMFQSPARSLTVEFQGGEPTLRFDTIRKIVEMVDIRNRIEQRDISFVLTSNATTLEPEVLAYMNEHAMVLSTSLDGPEDLHDANRPFQNRRTSSHAVVKDMIVMAQNALGPASVSALMTTTRASLTRASDIVAEYRRLGLHSVFARQISPFGFALRGSSSYSTEEFIAFYKDLLSAVIVANRDGFSMTEVYARILLRRMLTPFPTGYVDMQSPTGAVLGGVVYNYDGDVYPSDEARMLAQTGDSSLRLGSVFDDHRALFSGPVARALVDASIHASLPGCTDCALSPWCGADPVYHWATQRDPVGRRPESGFCRKNMAIMLHLLDLVEGDDPFVRRLLLRWATAEEHGE